MIALMADDETSTLVSFSLTIISAHPIDELAYFAGLTMVNGAEVDFVYSIYKTDFQADDWPERADRLHQAVTHALDLVDGTGISPSELHHPDVRVRAYYTFDPGSETIRAEAAKRLARINAAIWIDANA